jgi:hypothetical protein
MRRSKNEQENESHLMRGEMRTRACIIQCKDQFSFVDFAHQRRSHQMDRLKGSSRLVHHPVLVNMVHVCDYLLVSICASGGQVVHLVQERSESE